MSTLFSGTEYTSYNPLVLQGKPLQYHFCDFLIASLHAESLLKRVYLKRKDLLPLGANPFRLK